MPQQAQVPSPLQPTFTQVPVPEEQRAYFRTKKAVKKHNVSLRLGKLLTEHDAMESQTSALEDDEAFVDGFKDYYAKKDKKMCAYPYADGRKCEYAARIGKKNKQYYMCNGHKQHESGYIKRRQNRENKRILRRIRDRAIRDSDRETYAPLLEQDLESSSEEFLGEEESVEEDQPLTRNRRDAPDESLNFMDLTEDATHAPPIGQPPAPIAPTSTSVSATTMTTTTTDTSAKNTRTTLGAAPGGNQIHANIDMFDLIQEATKKIMETVLLGEELRKENQLLKAKVKEQKKLQKQKLRRDSERRLTQPTGKTLSPMSELASGMVELSAGSESSQSEAFDVEMGFSEAPAEEAPGGAKDSDA